MTQLGIKRRDNATLLDTCKTSKKKNKEIKGFGGAGSSTKMHVGESS